MFDIGFWELITLAAIALLIVGPEQIPKVARDAGQLIGRCRRFINNARNELERELELEEANQLNDSIKHVEKLMQEAPDRIMSADQSNKSSD